MCFTRRTQKTVEKFTKLKNNKVYPLPLTPPVRDAVQLATYNALLEKTSSRKNI